MASGASAEALAPASVALARGVELAAIQPASAEASPGKFFPHPYVKTGKERLAPPAPAEAVPDDLRSPPPYFKRPTKTFGARVAGAPTSWDIGDLCNAYDWPSGLPGGGKVAIVELDGGWAETDMRDFFARNNLPYPNIVDVPVTGYPGAGNNPNQHIGDPQDPDIEVTMDIQVAAVSYSLATGKAADIRVTGAARNPAASRTPCGKRRPRAATCARSPGKPTRRAGYCEHVGAPLPYRRWRTGQRTLWRRA